MRKTRYPCVFFSIAVFIGIFCFSFASAQNDSGEAMNIQDVSSVSNSDVPDSGAGSGSDIGIENVENVPQSRMAPVSAAQRNPAGGSSAGVKKRISSQSADTKSLPSKKNTPVWLQVVIFFVSLSVFVFILLYFFRKQLLQLLDKSSKDRKFLNENLKRFNIDLDKILPPGGSSKK